MSRCDGRGGALLPGRLYVLISHSHGDHLNPVVFGYENCRKDVVYVVAREAQDKVPKPFGLR